MTSPSDRFTTATQLAADGSFVLDLDLDIIGAWVKRLRATGAETGFHWHILGAGPASIAAPSLAQSLLGLRTPEGRFQVTEQWMLELWMTYPVTASRIARYIGETGVLQLDLNLSAADPRYGFTYNAVADVIASNPPGLFKGSDHA